MLFQAARTNMHNHHQGHTPRDWGKCTRLTHLRHQTCARRCDITRIHVSTTILIIMSVCFLTLMKSSSIGRREDKTRQDKPPIFSIPLLCLPIASRRTTALGCPRLVDLTCLVWPMFPQVFSPPPMLVYCFFWPLFLHFCPRDMPPVHVPPVASYTIRLRVAKPDEPFEPFPLAALPLVAAVIASRLLVQYDSRPVSHGLHGLV